MQISEGSTGIDKQCFFFSSAKNTAAANKTRGLIFMITRFFHYLCASTPYIWYASLFAKPRGRYQTFREKSTISYKAGYWHSSPPLGREPAGEGPLFLAVATATGRPVYRIQDIHGSLRC